MSQRQKTRVSKLVSHLSPTPTILSSSETRKIYNLTKNPISLKNKTVFITGASRGIGLAVAKRIAKDGANICIASKTASKHPTLPGTIYTAAKEIEECGGKCLAVICDIRFEEDVKNAINKCVNKFGGIDILINNASAIKMQNTQTMTMKRFDLIHNVNVRGTYMVTKYALPYLIKSSKLNNNPHILTMSPPLALNSKWLGNRVGYTISKLGMSLCTLGWSSEFKEYNIACNSLWPRYSVATEAVRVHFGGDYGMKHSRNVNIMSDSAYVILTQPSNKFNGNFVIDEYILKDNGINDFTKYRYDPNIDESKYHVDFFVENDTTKE